MPQAIATGPQLDWIVQATDVLQSGPGVPAPDNSLDPIDVTLQLASLITGALPGEFFDWIANALDSFREILNDFTGDSGAIRAHAQHCTDVATRVRAQADPVATAPGCTPTWTGTASLGFSSTMSAASQCVVATAGAIDDLGARHLVLGGMVAHVKQELITAVTKLAARLVKGALEAIARAGLALAGGVVEMVSGTVSGAVSGAWEGFKSGGPIGAVGGLFSGGANGAEEAARETARRLRAAWDAFVEWGGQEVAHVLEAVTDFVESSITPMVGEIGQMKGIGQRAERAAVILTSGRDPGNNADGPADGTAGQTAQGTEMQEPLDRDLIDVNAAIGDPNAELPPGYSRATPEQLAALGLTPDMLTDDNGFIAEVFIGPDGNPIVAFAGTTAGENPNTGVTPGVIYDDVVEDAAGAVTQSPQTQQVLAITEALSNSGQADDVVFTGHSLGGRLAAIASLDTGNAAITYNSAGVPPATVDYIANSNNTTSEALTQQANDGQVRRYYSGSDPLTYAQERNAGLRDAAPDALGYPIQVGPDDSTPFEGHSLSPGNPPDGTSFKERFEGSYPPPR